VNHCDGDDRCITCGDVAVEMTVLRVDAARGLALCEADGEKETVETELVGSVAPGDALLVHAGTALQRLGVAAAVARPDAESLVGTAGLDAPRR
jgi:hydrogenase assembly chaperone HypC/HupF